MINLIVFNICEVCFTSVTYILAIHNNFDKSTFCNVVIFRTKQVLRIWSYFIKYFWNFHSLPMK